MTGLDPEAIRKDFPILSRTVRNGKPLVYLDSGATSQNPVQVLDAEREYYERHNGAAHRGAHLLGEEATSIYEDARAKVAGFIGAEAQEVVFTKSATEAINLVAFSLTGSIKPGDEILISEIEHHANLVPWQQLCLRTGATLRWFTSLPDGRIDVDPSLITERTKIVAVTGQSNVTGVIPPVAEIAALAHEAGALVLCDAAQSVPHHPVDVKALDVDFLAFSGHKMLGPLGLGVLYGKYDQLEALPPFLTGGYMIEVVRMEEHHVPAAAREVRAGGPGGLAGRGPRRGGRLPDRARHGQRRRARGVAHRARARRARRHPRRPDHRAVPPPDRGGAVAFEVEGVHAHDVGQVLDELGIAVRTGHHCAWPLHRALGVQSSDRATFYVYNTHEEVDQLAEGVRYAKRFFGV